MTTVTRAPFLSHQEVLQAVPGLTYRQLDHWTRRGYFPVYDETGAPVESDPLDGDYLGVGSGFKRRWAADDLTILRRVLALTAIGFTPQAAHRVARGSDVEWLDQDRILISFWGDLA